MHRPGKLIEGTWKVIDFPPPVGISARVSLPCKTDRMISSCKGLKDEYPQNLFRIW
jgi:hypothetical protein